MRDLKTDELETVCAGCSCGAGASCVTSTSSTNSTGLTTVVWTNCGGDVVGYGEFIL